MSPIKKCKKNGKPGFKAGDSGTCYTYKPDDAKSRKQAKERAKEQLTAMKAND